MSFRIGQREIGSDRPAFVIAEAGVNHNGEVEIGKHLIEEAARAGADAVKFQAFRPEEITTRRAAKAEYQDRTTSGGGGQYEMLRELSLSAEEQQQLRDYCADIEIPYLCTPYDSESVELLESLEVEAYKISSSDITNIPLLRFVAEQGRPVILSTGMSNLGEVEDAVTTLRSGLDRDELCLLHCLSAYPAPHEDLNLSAIRTLRAAFDLPVGFSDHTTGTMAAGWARAIGACILEKHFTLDRNMSGPDHRASLEPDELEEYVATVRAVEEALGDGRKRVMPSERSNKSKLRKSLVANRPIPAGEILQRNDLAAKRPATGLSPLVVDSVVGRRTRKKLDPDDELSYDVIDWDWQPPDEQAGGPAEEASG